jgi:hypothetical protein
MKLLVGGVGGLVNPCGDIFEREGVFSRYKWGDS